MKECTGKKFAKTDTRTLWNILETGPKASHKNLKKALAGAKTTAASPHRGNAAVLQPSDMYEVLELPELSTVSRHGKNRTSYNTNKSLVSVFSRQSNSVHSNGVRRGSNSTMSMAQVRDVFIKAGCGTADFIKFMRNGLGPTDIATLRQTLQMTPPTLQGFGPRVLLLGLLRQVEMRGEPISGPGLLRAIRNAAPLVVLRPDGYLTGLSTGNIVQKVSEVRWEKTARGERLVSGPLEVGQPYFFQGGVLYNIGPHQKRQGPAIYEIHLQDGLGLAGRALDGVEKAVESTVRGIAQLIQHPIDSIEGLRNLPRAVQSLIVNSPEYWARFQNMPVGDQVEEVCRITSHVALTMSGGAGISSRLGTLGKGVGNLSVSTLSIGLDGTLAYAVATVPVGSVVTALSGGAGAVYILHQGARSAQAIEAITLERTGRSAKWDWEHIVERHHPSGGPAQQRMAADGPKGLGVFEGVSIAGMKRIVKSAWKSRKRIGTQSAGEANEVVIFKGFDAASRQWVKFWQEKSGKTLAARMIEQ